MRTFLFSLGLLFLGFTSFSQQVAKSLTANGSFIGFYEYKPVNYSQNPGKKYPLIIFLHGIGERGNGTSELPLLLSQGIPKNINEGATMTFTVNGKTETFLVLSPQLPKWLGAWDNLYVDAMLDYAKNNLRVDENRIFLTGLSLGGGGVWSYASASLKNAKKFAAIAPICGVCYYDLRQLEPTIGKADIGVWGFANMDDGVVSPWCTISAIDELSKNKSKKIKKTINQWGGHDAWTKAYDVGHSVNSPNLYEWFLNEADGKTDAPDTETKFPVNASPVAKAGNDISITLPNNSITLNNAGSYDSDGDIKGWNWTKVSGPAQFSIQSANSASTSVNNLVPGTYVFRLTVTDNGNATATDDITVIVNAAANAAPVAKAGDDIVITLPANNVSLNNAGSYDSDGNIKAWNWTKVSGPSEGTIGSANSASTSVTNLTAGTYVFRLTVTDNDNSTASDDVVVTVHPAANAAPVAKAGNDINIILPVNSVTLSNAGSYDADGSIKGWNWSKISGPSDVHIASANNSSTQITNLVVGSYVFRLTVTDNDNATAFDDITVNVSRAPNRAPVARAGIDINITLPTNSASLSSAGSSDDDGNITGWNWTKVSGPSQFGISTPNGVATQVNNLVAGSYVFRLTLTDDDGATASDDITITVNPAPAPVSKVFADAGKDEKIPVGQATVLRADLSHAEGSSIKSYKWTKFSGPASYEMLTPDEMTTWIRNMEEGVYVYRLTVTDNNGSTDTDDVTITVKGSLPVSLAGKDETIPVGQATVLHGEASYVLGGYITSYTWTKISGPANYEIMNPNSKSTWIRNMSPGIYVYRLSIKDNNGYEGVDDVMITVKGGTAPVANAGNDETVPQGQATVLHGENSYAVVGNIKSYKWSKISGPGYFEITTPDAKTTWIRNMVIGTYVYRLTVTDNNGGSSYDDVTVTVTTGSPTLAARNGNGANDQSLAPTEINAGTIAVTEKLNIYPNPVVSSLNIRWSGQEKGNATIKIIDAHGRIVKTMSVKKEQLDYNTSVEVSTLAPGIYIIQIQSQNGKPLNTQFLKR
jgi:hypothetical protein